MYLTDLLFTLSPGVFVRIKFDGNPNPFCFITGPANTAHKIVELIDTDRGESKVYEINPLWHAQELYIKCT